MIPVVKSLHFYPVKSCKGTDLPEAIVDERGIKHDRSWLIVTEGGLAVTQRDYAQLALVDAQMLDDMNLRFSAPGKSELLVEARSDGAQKTVKVWDDTCEAIDQGEASSIWLSDFLGTKVSLVRMKNRFVRPVTSEYATSADQQVGFADGFPFLLISQESLDDLNQKLEASVLMNRFRPNIVISGCKAFSEDDWRSIRIGNVQFDIVKPCSRCVMVSIDQEDASLSKEPMRTLTLYRQKGKKILFGQNLVHHSTGVIRVGDKVEIIK